jgi:beta-glucosidase
MTTQTVDELLDTMTLEEKIAQLVSVKPYMVVDENNRFSPEKAAEVLKFGIGQISALSGTLAITPEQSAELANTIQTYLKEHTRLSIPAMIHEECLSGFCAREATIFPQAIGLGSTWDPNLIQEMTTHIRAQMRAVGAHHALAPVLDVIRDPRWGRCEETMGEDPYLIAEMGCAYVRGLQGDDLKESIAATAKHFAAHALSEGGRNCAPVHLGMRELRDIYLYPFEKVVQQAKIETVMNAYHDIDGVPCAASRELLTGILRDEWGFAGPVVSDYFAVEQLISKHHVAADKKEAACQALEAGIDIELPFGDCYPELIAALREGRIDQATLDQAVRRIIQFKQDVGLFEHCLVAVDQVSAHFHRPQDHELSRRVAQKTLVLLKNDNNLLPLKKNLKTIAVIGPNADSCRNMLGDYHYNVTYSAQEKLTEMSDNVDDLEAYGGVRITSVLAGIRAAVSAGTEVRYARGCDLTGASTAGFAEAVETARAADVAVVVVGDQAGMFINGISGENIDRVDATLLGVQNELVKQIVATGTPVVLVLLNGRPLILQDALEAGAILEAWHPGEAGGQAVADVLFGDATPGGKLPVTLLRSIGQTPLTYNLKAISQKDYLEGPLQPTFPFGHGLSYTQFAYSNLVITPERVTDETALTIRFDICNSGEREGEEVVQMYVHDVVASLVRPIKALKGFRRIKLAPGETQTVSFTLGLDELAFYNAALQRVVEPGDFEIFIGSSSADIRLQGTFAVAYPWSLR